MDMDPDQQLHQNFLHPGFTKPKTTTTFINTSCHLPDSTTESPTASPMESVLLQNIQNTLPQLTTCSTNHLLQADKTDNTLDTFKTLDDNEVADLISGVSDVMVDSTQPTQTLLDLPQFVDHSVNNFGFMDPHHITHAQTSTNHLSNTHYNVPFSQSSNVTQSGVQLNQSNVTHPDIQHSHVTQHGVQLQQSNASQQSGQHSRSNLTQPGVQHSQINVTQPGVQFSQSNLTQPGVQLGHGNVTQHSAQLLQSNASQHSVQLNQSNFSQPDVQVSQSNVTQQNVQLNQSNISLIIQPELNKDDQKLPQNLVGHIDQCISRIQPNFSNYPPYCKCQVVDKVVAVEQIWVCNEQMYFLPQICILAIANQEHTGIFYDGNKCFIALGEVMEKMMPQYEADLIKFIQRCEDVEQQILTPQEVGYLQQRKCISETCTYKTAITLSLLRQMAQYITMYEGHKAGFDPRIKAIANDMYYRKILQRYVRCATCGGIILCSPEPDEFVILNTETNMSKDESKCFSVGFINAGGEKFVAFKSDGRVYVSLKELCFKKVFKLHGLQVRLQTLRQRPRLAPSVLNNYLNTPQYNVSNTMWIDIGTLRCVCCMGKCIPGYNVDVYNCFARVNFTENIVTNIYGQDDYQNDKAVYTMDPKTLEVVMKKMPMKSKFKPENKASVTKKKLMKSFELSSKEMSGYESPEKLNDSAFLFEKQDDDSLEEQHSSIEFEKQVKSNKNAKHHQFYASTDHTFFKKDETKTKWENSNISNPKFRVKPAERPYKYTEIVKERQETNVNISRLNNLTPHEKGKKSARSRNKSGQSSQTRRKKKSQEDDALESHCVGAEKRPDNTDQNGHLNTSVSLRDETSNAVSHLMEEFGNVGDYDLHSTDPLTTETSNETQIITPRTENRILSRIDLNGSINDMFETPNQRNVVVELMDTDVNNAFDYSSSELTRLYDQYERFEKSVTPDRTSESLTATETETSLHRRNEIDMPIDTSLSKIDKPVSKINNENQSIKNQYSHVVNSQISNSSPESLKKNMQLTVTTEHSSPEKTTELVSPHVSKSDTTVTKGLSPNRISFNESSTQVLSTCSVSCDIVPNSEDLSVDNKNRYSKILSPVKSTGTLLNSPRSTSSVGSACTHSPVFKKTGEIDRSHAKVKKLTEMVHHSEALDFLASVAEVITDESMNQALDTVDEGHVEMCAISDENLNIEKIQISSDITDVVRSESNFSDVREQMCKVLQEVKGHVNIDPYKDPNSGHWKVKIQLKPGAKVALPGLFGDDVDTKKRNQFLAILGKLHLPSMSNVTSLEQPVNNLYSIKDSCKNRIHCSRQTTLKQSNHKKKLKSSSSKNSKKPILKANLDYDLMKKSHLETAQKKKSSKRPSELSQEGMSKKKKRLH